MSEPAQTQPGNQAVMDPQPKTASDRYKGSDKLKDKVALITGGDSGIGRSVAVLYAREGADVAINYLSEDGDAEETKRLVEAEGRKCYVSKGDVGDSAYCARLVEETVQQLGKLDILVNNAAEQHMEPDLTKISDENWEQTFRTNIHGMFYLTKAALPHLKQGSSMINTSSVNAFKGNPALIAYTATKGAITAFTRSIAIGPLAQQGIRVNSVAPGPIWTPLIPSTIPADSVESFGQDAPLGRAGQPDEVAPAYVWLASDEASYITGQSIHINGGMIVNA